MNIGDIVKFYKNELTDTDQVIIHGTIINLPEYRTDSLCAIHLIGGNIHCRLPETLIVVMSDDVIDKMVEI